MMKKVALVAAITLSLAACKTIPVEDYSSEVGTTTSSKVTKKNVEKAILDGCKVRRWNCKVESDGVVAGLLNWRGTQVKVGIHFDESRYTVKYRDSFNMKYNGKKIHKKYGKWVNNLVQAIDGELFYIK